MKSAWDALMEIDPSKSSKLEEKESIIRGSCPFQFRQNGRYTSIDSTSCKAAQGGMTTCIECWLVPVEQPERITEPEVTKQNSFTFVNGISTKEEK